MNIYYKRGLSFVILIVFAWLSVHFFQVEILLHGLRTAAGQPLLIAVMFAVYLLSFCAKAAAWKLYMPEYVRFGTALYGILYSLFINHIVPVKAGDLVRVKLMSIRERGITDEQSLHSVLVLRILDMAVLISIALSGLFLLDWPFSLSNVAFIIVGVAAVVAALLYLIRPAFFKRHWQLFRSAMLGRNGLVILGLTVLSWLLEASIVFGTVLMLGGELSLQQAVFVNSMTVGGQVLQITPGGIGNYESFFVFSLSLLGFSIQDAYTAALLTHGLKFVFSYIAGFIVWQLYPLPLRDIKKWILIKGEEKK